MDNTWNDVEIEPGEESWKYSMILGTDGERQILPILEEEFTVPLLQADRERMEDGRLKVVFILDPEDGSLLFRVLERCGCFTPESIFQQSAKSHLN